MPKRNLAWILIVLLAAVATWVAIPADVRNDELEMYRPLLEVYRHLDSYYVERLDPDTKRRFIEGAIRGAIRESLDHNSEYYPPKQAEEFRQLIQGHFTGVGIQIEPRDGGIFVATPIESSPAFAAGIMPDDQIIEVDGTSTSGMSLADAVSAIKGPPNTDVVLTILRESTGERIEFKITRRRIIVPPVKGFTPNEQGQWDYVLRPADSPPLGYLRVIEFVDSDDNTTMARFDAALEQCRAAGVHGLIIDLRDNPGGILRQALSMVDRFVSSGLIISERGAHHSKEHRATRPGTLEDMPIVVLINARSASASEIVAGSLACHQRAVLVGTRSFGKGTMQETILVRGVDGGNAMLKLTTAYYYLPNGQNINKITPPTDFDRPRQGGVHEQTVHRGGIQPTVVIKLSEEQQRAVFEWRRRLDLLYPQGEPPATQPVARPTGPAATSPSTQPESMGREEWAEQLFAVDLQLAEAIRILSDPERYRELLARTPATAPDEEDTAP